MDDALRRSAAHVLVDDVAAPVLTDADSHHVFRVLRVGDGAMVTVTDGRGSWRLCRAIVGSSEPMVVADGEVHYSPQPAEPVALYVAVPKQDRPEWLVQKATEIGVDRIVFIHAERSVVRWSPDRAARHLTKLAAVATQAALQSRRVHVPSVEGPIAALEVLARGQVPLAEPGGRALSDADRQLAIGPEGGWSPTELAAAADRVDLGPHVLRVETAAVVAAVHLVTGRQRAAGA